MRYTFIIIFFLLLAPIGKSLDCCDVNTMNVTIYAPNSASATYSMSYRSESGTCGTTPAVNETWNYSGYTFCPVEGSYTAVLNVSSSGSDTSCGTYVSETSTSQNLYTVNWDTDYNWCTCKLGSGKWNTTLIAWETETPSCCGDDTNENKITRKCNSDVCTSDATNWGCCNDSTDCVYGSSCFANKYSGDVDNDDANENCSSGTWISPYPPSCKGNMRFVIEPAFAAPSSHVLPYVSGLENCDGQTIYFSQDSCSGQQFSSCTVSDGKCTGNSFYVPQSSGAYTYYACVEKKESSLIYMVGYSNLPDFGLLGIIQIMVIASAALVFSKVRLYRKCK